MYVRMMYVMIAKTCGSVASDTNTQHEENPVIWNQEKGASWQKAHSKCSDKVLVVRPWYIIDADALISVIEIG